MGWSTLPFSSSFVSPVRSTDALGKYKKEKKLLAYVNGGTYAKENLDSDVLSKNFKRLIEMIDTRKSIDGNTSN